MTLKLHTNYSSEEAIEAVADTSPRQAWCDGQFIVLPKDVLCFATVGNPADKPHFDSPSTFIWKPHRLDYDPSDATTPWLPAAVREVWHPASRKRIKAHHIFVRTGDEADFFYAGTAHLGSYGGYLNKGEVSATFTLFEKLPQATWLRLGGYSGWLIDLNHSTHRVNDGDLATFNHLLEQLHQQEFSHLSLTRYEEDSLQVHTNSNRGWLMYLREPGDSGVYVNDSKREGHQMAEEVFACTCGIPLEFPYHQTVSVEEALQVATEFFVSGQLPDLVPWEWD